MDQKESASKTSKNPLLRFVFASVATLAILRLGLGVADWRLILAAVMFVCVIFMITWNQNAALRRAKNISESIISKHREDPGARSPQIQP